MVVEHLHHHAMLGAPEYGATASRGTSAYRFAVSDLARAFRSAVTVERARLARLNLGWWHNMVLQDYSVAGGLIAVVAVLWGALGIVLLIGQAVFAVFAFEVITYVHHYGLVCENGEDPGPHHAWAHHCWLTNCLTFNNTFHADHHLRPRSPYYELHAMHGSPRLPASYFTMFFAALIPPLWYRLIHPRLDAFNRMKAAGDQQIPEWMRIAQCR
jgi:alkane 1-monooxygenase